MKLQDIGTHTVVTIAPGATAEEAARIMKEQHVGDLIVLHDNAAQRPLGIVTDRDLVTFVMACGVAPDRVQVADIMAQNLVVVRERDDLQQATRIMRAAGVRRLPIVDAAGALVGVISIDDIYAHLAEELNNIAEVAARQIHQEECEPALEERFLV